MWSKQAINAYVAREAVRLPEAAASASTRSCPGPTDTPLAQANKDMWLGFGADYRAEAGIEPSTPLEQAYPLVFLCSDAASYDQRRHDDHRRRLRQLRHHRVVPGGRARRSASSTARSDRPNCVWSGDSENRRRVTTLTALRSYDIPSTAATAPPSTSRSMPVMKLASSETRNAAAAASSSAGPGGEAASCPRAPSSSAAARTPGGPSGCRSCRARSNRSARRPGRGHGLAPTRRCTPRFAHA